jgi:Na+/H+-dicarboxylate symporter
MSAGRYRTSRGPIRTVGISPRRLIDHTRVFGTASSSATCPAVIKHADTAE